RVAYGRPARMSLRRSGDTGPQPRQYPLRVPNLGAVPAIAQRAPLFRGEVPLLADRRAPRRRSMLERDRRGHRDVEAAGHSPHGDDEERVALRTRLRCDPRLLVAEDEGRGTAKIELAERHRGTCEKAPVDPKAPRSQRREAGRPILRPADVEPALA